jgi:hypothetical protein
MFTKIKDCGFVITFCNCLGAFRVFLLKTNALALIEAASFLGKRKISNSTVNILPKKI